MGKLQLPNVTAIALTDHKFKEHQEVLDEMCEDIEFGDAKVIFDRGINHDVNNWNKKIVYDLWKYFDTSHCFLFHADGYIITPSLWDPAWLELDYIGAPWPLPTDTYSYRDPAGSVQRVGNSVGLRSHKLSTLPHDLGLEWKSYYGNTNEDGFFSVHNRKILEDNGCVFGTFEQALKFSKEAPLPENEDIQTFAFHQYG